MRKYLIAILFTLSCGPSLEPKNNTVETDCSKVNADVAGNVEELDPDFETTWCHACNYTDACERAVLWVDEGSTSVLACEAGESDDACAARNCDLVRECRS